jgi:hypothetical protein
MSEIIRQSTARTVIVGPILDADGVAVTDGVVGDLKISKNGAAPAALNGSATLTHRHTGHYSLALTTSDTDTVGTAQITIDDTVNAMPPKELTVIEEAVYDALYAASATGLLPANVTQIGGDSQSATDLKDFADAGYDPSTNKVQGVVLVDTTTDLTNLPTIPANWLTAAGTAADFGTEIGTAVWATATRVLTAATNISGPIADQVWEEAIADHSGTAGSTAEALNAAGSAGDPWVTALPGSYTAGQAGHTVGTFLTGNAFTRLGAPAGASVSADIAAVKTDTGNLVTRITSTLFSGITSLAEWLGLLAGKQTGDTTARTELRATGAGGGTFDETTDSLEAVRDRGDAAWITATGFSTHTAADVWTNGTRTLTAIDEDATTLDLDATIRASVGLAAANLDTQLGSILTDTTQIKADLPTRPSKNVAFSNFVFLMVDATDLSTPETGLTVTAEISKDGGAFAACTNSVSEISGGFYKINLTQTEMNADVVALKLTGTGAAQRSVVIYTQPT